MEHYPYEFRILHLLNLMMDALLGIKLTVLVLPPSQTSGHSRFEVQGSL